MRVGTSISESQGDSSFQKQCCNDEMICMDSVYCTVTTQMVLIFYCHHLGVNLDLSNLDASAGRLSRQLKQPLYLSPSTSFGSLWLLGHISKGEQHFNLFSEMTCWCLLSDSYAQNIQINSPPFPKSHNFAEMKNSITQSKKGKETKVSVTLTVRAHTHTPPHTHHIQTQTPQL